MIPTACNSLDFIKQNNSTSCFHFPEIPTRRDNKASRMWFGCARFNMVLLKRTRSSSCSLLNKPVSGCSPVLVTMPSLTHCQNCVCVVQNSFRSRQITSAVFFFFFFFLALC